MIPSRFQRIVALAASDDPTLQAELSGFQDESLLGELMVAVYQTQSARGRSALEPLLLAPFAPGRWQGFKRIYKLAEAEHDVATWALQARVVDQCAWAHPVSPRTVGYLQRRVYRHLKGIAGAGGEQLFAYLEALLPRYRADESSQVLERVFRAQDPGFLQSGPAQGFRAGSAPPALADDEGAVEALLSLDDAGLTRAASPRSRGASEPGGAPTASAPAAPPAATPVTAPAAAPGGERSWRGPVFPEAWVADPARLVALLGRTRHARSAGGLAQLLEEQAGEALGAIPLDAFYALLEHPSAWRFALGQLAGRARLERLRFDALVPLVERVARAAEWPVLEDLLFVFEDEQADVARAGLAEVLIGLARTERDAPEVGLVVDFVRRHFPRRIGPPLIEVDAALELLGARRPDVRGLGQDALVLSACAAGLRPGHLRRLLGTSLPDDSPELVRALLLGGETGAGLAPGLLSACAALELRLALQEAPEPGFLALRGALLAREEQATAAPRAASPPSLWDSLPGLLVDSPERRVRALGLDLLGGALRRGELDLLEVVELLRVSREDVVVWVRAAVEAAAAEGRLGNEALYRMLDALQADVRGFARGLVEEHLARFEVAELICFCAESPDAPTAALGIELYRARLHGREDYDLAQLLPMFRVLLYRVAQARPEKERLYGLLRAWALERVDHARLASEVVAGFRRSRSRIDLSRALGLLAQIALRYPEVELPLTSAQVFGHVLAPAGGEA